MRILQLVGIVFVSMLFVACGGPSEEEIRAKIKQEEAVKQAKINEEKKAKAKKDKKEQEIVILADARVYEMTAMERKYLDLSLKEAKVQEYKDESGSIYGYYFLYQLVKTPKENFCEINKHNGQTIYRDYPTDGRTCRDKFKRWGKVYLARKDKAVSIDWVEKEMNKPQFDLILNNLDKYNNYK